MIASLLAVAVFLPTRTPMHPPASAPTSPARPMSTGQPSAPPPWSRPPPPTLSAARASGAVVLDGLLDDSAWARAIASDGFIQQFPNEADRPTDRTTVRVLYDDRALYVGIDCEQKSTPIVARLTRRDRVAPADRVTVDISSRSDRVTAFHFGVNAAGVLDDGIYFNDGDFSADWDENWQAATSIRADGWSVEIKIPFRILRFDAAPDQRWGLQVQRYTELRHEWDLWSFRSRSAAGFVSTFGTLEGLVGVRPSRPVELRFSELLKAQFRDVEARGPLAKPHDWAWSFEISGKAHPTQATTLDLTVNPDFGQVDADQVVLNLSNYEVFYPEKRPFFLEGLDTLSTTRSVLYTRRIGARPADPSLNTAAAERLVDTVGPTHILGAAKLVGAATPRNHVGLLSALTGENAAQIQLADGTTTVSRPVDPMTVYNVMRARHLFGFGDLGFLATSTNRFEHPGGYRALDFRCPARVASPDPVVAADPTVSTRCFNDAYVAAVDGRWRSPGANYVVFGQALGTTLTAGPDRPQRDGVAIQPGRPSFGATVSAAKQGGAHWLATLSEAFSGRQLDYNDLGYLDRKNDTLTYADLTYRTLDRWRSTTDTATTLAASHRQTLDGLRLEDAVRLSTYAMFTNFWASSFTLYYHAAHFDDRETGDGTALERAGLVGTELWIGTDSRRVWSGAFWGQFQRITDGIQAQASASVVLRPLSRLDLELAPSILYTSGEPRFISADAVPPAVTTYSFGKLRARNVSLTVRATVGLRPTLTFQVYSQLFLATKQYSSVSHVITAVPRSQVRVSDLLPAGIVQPDTEQAVLNVNAVLRWEYRLGSVIYLVYTRAQSPVLTVTPGDPARLSPGPLGGNRGSTDAVMLKASYWWG